MLKEERERERKRERQKGGRRRKRKMGVGEEIKRFMKTAVITLWRANVKAKVEKYDQRSKPLKIKGKIK